MDRRQRRTREAIFAAFAALLSQKEFGQITVGEIIIRADIGRATFYAHFETKDDLLKELCAELFCHIADVAASNESGHRHIFTCDEQDDVFCHLFRHLKQNDNRVLQLLSGRNNVLFLQMFKTNLRKLVVTQLPRFSHRKSECLPEDFWTDHITAVFVETVRWWVDNGLRESPETITTYFFLSV